MIRLSWTGLAYTILGALMGGFMGATYAYNKARVNVLVTRNNEGA